MFGWQSPLKINSRKAVNVTSYYHFKNVSSSFQSKRIIIHEMMHSMGFFHEHNRPDRDNFVKVNWENIQPRAYSQFYKNRDPDRDLPNCRDLEGPNYDDCDNGWPVNTYGTPYDYDSVMHYSRNT